MNGLIRTACRTDFATSRHTLPHVPGLAPVWLPGRDSFIYSCTHTDNPDGRFFFGEIPGADTFDPDIWRLAIP